MIEAISLGAIGATIYDVVRRIKNGAFKQLAQNILNELSIQTVMQATEPIKNDTTVTREGHSFNRKVERKNHLIYSENPELINICL